ncbi:hypothetical protein VTK56DRAFT_2500 [Thermocarpiscus australiensis]
MTDQDVDDKFPQIERLLGRPTEVLDLTEEDPPLGQPESPRQQPMAETDGHLQDNLFSDNQTLSHVGPASAHGSGTRLFFGQCLDRCVFGGRPYFVAGTPGG